LATLLYGSKPQIHSGLSWRVHAVIALSQIVSCAVVKLRN
jgi:hypothetical protein